MSTVKSNLIVLSEYLTKIDHVGFSMLYDLDLQFKKLGAQFIHVEDNKSTTNPKLFNKFLSPYKLKKDNIEFNANSNLLIICSTPHFLLSLNQLKKQIATVASVSVYFVDGFDAKTLDGIGPSLLRNVDQIFVPFEEMLDDLDQLGNQQVNYLPFGIDALKYNHCDFDKKIDIFSYGRTNKQYHSILEKEFGREDNQYFYFHSTFKNPQLHSQYEHRRLHWKMLLHSKISMCFEASNVPRFCNTSPVLYRWYECLAAGNVIVGTRPKSHSANQLLGWTDSTIEVPDNEKDFLALIYDLLNDTVRIDKISIKNKYEALKQHDWRYRVYDIYKALNMNMPSQLVDELDLIRLRLNEMNPQ